ncbi:MAG: GAF domain-containing protein, partial [Chloroflexota bacterium]
DITIITLVTYLLSRSWQNGRSKLFEANFHFALERLQHKYDAKLVFLRIHSTDGARESLVLTSCSPSSLLNQSHGHKFMCLDIDEGRSLASTAFKSGRPMIVNNKEHLLESMHHRGFVEQFDLQHGMVIPLLATESQTQPYGTISLYWSTEEDFKRANESLVEDIQQLGLYVARESNCARFSAEEVINLYYQQEISARLNDWLERIQDNIDFWETANLIVKAASDLASYEVAFIFFWDGEEERYCLHLPYGFNDTTRNCVGAIEQDLDIATTQLSSTQLPGAQLTGDSPKADRCVSIPKALSISQIAKEQTYPFNLLTTDRTWGDQTDFHDCLAFPLQSGDKALGLLVLATREEKELSIGMQELLLSLARHSAVDLRNCQLLNKAETRADMTEALRRMIHELFSPTSISDDEADLYRTIAVIIQEAVQAHSCSFGLLDVQNKRLDPTTFITTDKNVQDKVNVNDPKTIDLVAATLASEKGIYKIDYRIAPERRSMYVRRAKIRCAYGARIQLNDTEQGIMFINYWDVSPRIEYQIKQILPLIQEHVPKAWSAWKAWSKAQNHQRQMWKYDIHDQLNELQFNVTLPLERLHYSAQQTVNGTLTERLRVIHYNARSVATTLKHIMDDMRHPVLIDEGLLAALHYLGNKYPKLGVNVLEANGEPPAQVANPIYRLAREAIHNGFKHGGNEVTLSIQLSRDRLYMTIIDNGLGFDHRARHGSGMTLMQYQADLIGAILAWLPRSDGHTGTVVQINWHQQ